MNCPFMINDPDVKNSFTEFTQASGFNVMRKIFENAESYSPDVLLGALNSINIIASNPNHRSALVEVDYIPALLKLLPLSPDKWPYIHETVCNIIGNILCDPSTHAEFCKEKGPEIILKIIDSGDLSVVSAIVPIVIVSIKYARIRNAETPIFHCFNFLGIILRLAVLIQNQEKN